MSLRPRIHGLPPTAPPPNAATATPATRLKAVLETGVVTAPPQVEAMKQERDRAVLERDIIARKLTACQDELDYMRKGMAAAIPEEDSAAAKYSNELIAAVTHMDVENVRRLLADGANLMSGGRPGEQERAVGHTQEIAIGTIFLLVGTVEQSWGQYEFLRDVPGAAKPPWKPNTTKAKQIIDLLVDNDHPTIGYLKREMWEHFWYKMMMIAYGEGVKTKISGKSPRFGLQNTDGRVQRQLAEMEYYENIDVEAFLYLMKSGLIEVSDLIYDIQKYLVTGKYGWSDIVKGSLYRVHIVPSTANLREKVLPVLDRLYGHYKFSKRNMASLGTLKQYFHKDRYEHDGDFIRLAHSNVLYPEEAVANYELVKEWLESAACFDNWNATMLRHVMQTPSSNTIVLMHVGAGVNELRMVKLAIKARNHGGSARIGEVWLIDPRIDEETGKQVASKYTDSLGGVYVHYFSGADAYTKAIKRQHESKRAASVVGSLNTSLEVDAPYTVERAALGKDMHEFMSTMNSTGRDGQRPLRVVQSWFNKKEGCVLRDETVEDFVERSTAEMNFWIEVVKDSLGELPFY